MDLFEYDEDAMPCVCALCNGNFDLPDGNPCGECKTIYCENCLEEPFDTCERCDE